MGKKKKRPAKTGIHHGKVDIDRIGFFDDYTIAPPDKFEAPPKLRETFWKGRQMMCKKKGGFFESDFKRVFLGEALTEPWRVERREKMAAKAKMTNPILMPPPTTKHHSTPGDWYGCIGSKPERFSPELKTKPPYRKMPRNFQTRPNPAGGPGYIEICLSPYIPMYPGYEPYIPEDQVAERRIEDVNKPRIFFATHAPKAYFNPRVFEPYDMPERREKRKKKPNKRKIIFHYPFPKLPGGDHSGCFDKFPEFLGDPIIPLMRGGRFRIPKWHSGGNGGLKTKYTSSIVNRVTDVACNASNFTDYREQVFRLDS